MLKVCGHRLLLRPFKLEEIDQVYKKAKQAGIELLDLDEKKREQNAVDKGTVIAIGESAWKDFGTNPWALVGDLVVYPKYSGKWVEDPSTKEKYLILNDEDILCVVQE